MLAEALAALAAAGGGAVVQAAGTDAWHEVRARVAELVGRGDAERGRAELERLDRTARALEPSTADSDREVLRQEGAWQERFTALLESLDGEDRERVVQGLRTLADRVADATGDTALDTGNALARDGASAVSGVQRSGGGPAAARAVRTGDAEATGLGSTAVSGVVNG
ncbi:hypothetical protein ACF09E_09700 [Streptomyces sp. NPDC014891]|uniref:hypothetical protein n=1 Tax=Streptomyces sp. NPDC014891 TaxID=3364929 RepID=UPI00370261DD